MSNLNYMLSCKNTCHIHVRWCSLVHSLSTRGSYKLYYRIVLLYHRRFCDKISEIVHTAQSRRYTSLKKVIKHRKRSTIMATDLRTFEKWFKEYVHVTITTTLCLRGCLVRSEAYGIDVSRFIRTSTHYLYSNQ